jgi:hypothetical protein
MGMYTEIFINVTLLENTPADVIETLKAICNSETDSPALKNHPKRWAGLFNNGSYYTPQTHCGNLTYDSTSNQWSLLGKGDIKNYDRDIQTFFEWIEPHVDASRAEFMGYHRYEETPTPILIFKPDTNVTLAGGSNHPKTRVPITE